MPYEWISARRALTYVATALYEWPAMETIFRRAAVGELAASAEALLIGDERHENVTVPRQFWKLDGDDGC